MSDVYNQSCFQHFMPCIIRGKDAKGNRYPPFPCSTKDLNLAVKRYYTRYPKVVRVLVDVALGEKQ